MEIEATATVNIQVSQRLEIAGRSYFLLIKASLRIPATRKAKDNERYVPFPESDDASLEVALGLELWIDSLLDPDPDVRSPSFKRGRAQDQSILH